MLTVQVKWLGIGQTEATINTKTAKYFKGLLGA